MSIRACSSSGVSPKPSGPPQVPSRVPIAFAFSWIGAKPRGNWRRNASESILPYRPALSIAPALIT